MEEKLEHLDILRVLVTAPRILISTNNAFPMIREVQLGRITLGVRIYSGCLLG